MSRFWLILSKVGIWLFGAYLAWHLYGVVAMGAPQYWPDTLRLIAALISLVFARQQMKRKYDEKQRNKQALRDWAAEEELESGTSDA